MQDFFAFHVVFGKSVPDNSLNAAANLSFAAGRWLAPVLPSDALRAESIVIRLKAKLSGISGVVWLWTRGLNHHGAAVLDYVSWVIVKARVDGGLGRQACDHKAGRPIFQPCHRRAVPKLNAIACVIFVC